MSMPNSSEAVATTARRSPALSAVLDGQAKLSGQAAMVGQHNTLAQSFLQMMGDAFTQPTGVHEDQSRPVGTNQLGYLVVDVAPHLVGREHAELFLRHLDREVELAAVSGIHSPHLAR